MHLNKTYKTQEHELNEKYPVTSSGEAIINLYDVS